MLGSVLRTQNRIRPMTFACVSTTGVSCEACVCNDLHIHRKLCSNMIHMTRCARVCSKGLCAPARVADVSVLKVPVSFFLFFSTESVLKVPVSVFKVPESVLKLSNQFLKFPNQFFM